MSTPKIGHWTGLKALKFENGRMEMHRMPFVAGAALAFVLLAPGLSVADPVKPAAADRALGMALMHASIGADGTLLSAAGAISASRVGTGQYEVVFDRIVVACGFTGTLGGATTFGSPIGMIAVSRRGGNDSAVFVVTRDEAGAVADLHFSVLIVCTR